MKKLPGEFEDDIPLGYAIFVVNENLSGTRMMPDVMMFQTEGRLFKPEDIDPEIFDEEMLTALDHLRVILRSRTQEESY